jgi:hypothetical protein
VARTSNKLTRQDQFRLNVAVQQHGDTPHHKTFTTYEAAAEFFGKQLGLTLTPKNMLGACKTVGKQSIVVPVNGAGVANIGSVWGRLEAAASRIALLESRVAELEALVKS